MAPKLYLNFGGFVKVSLFPTKLCVVEIQLDPTPEHMIE